MHMEWRVIFSAPVHLLYNEVVWEDHAVDHVPCNKSAVAHEANH